jgi:NTP pyrophosphatase (non-canonical NTP hydrolase)
MAYDEDSIDWLAIHAIDRWLDSAVSEEYIRQPLAQDWARIGKVIEELGESIRALIGYTGQNPRKGFTHSQEDMLEELADSAITAILGMQHFTKNTSTTRLIIMDKIKAIERRVPNRVPINPPVQDDLWAGKGFIQ